ncbi:hypothetical protein H1C71_027616 [Ictidomys tridecemlineatus]|nr:hypothetical protein H1C71_027616 [Ictidomys tridecemlineatus]
MVTVFILNDPEHKLVCGKANHFPLQTVVILSLHIFIKILYENYTVKHEDKMLKLCCVLLCSQCRIQSKIPFHDQNASTNKHVERKAVFLAVKCCISKQLPSSVKLQQPSY